MTKSKTKTIIFLILLPFLITIIERFVIAPSVSMFSLPATSIQMVKVGSISLLLFALMSYLGNTYGLEITKKLKRTLTIMFVILLGSSYLFLYSLHLKGFFDTLAVVHLFNWIVTVFREELILRGIIQTEAGYVLNGNFLRISKSIWLTSILFAVWHLVNLSVWPWQVVALQMLACLPSGIIFGLIKEKTGSTLLTYLLHLSGDLIFFSLYLLIFSKLFLPLF